MLAQSNSITITKRKLAPSKQGVGWVQNTYTLLLIAAVAALVISALTYLIKASSASVVIVPVANQEHAPVKSEAAGASEGSQPEAAMDAESGGTAAEVMDDVELQRIRTAAGILDPELMQHAPPMNAFDPIFKSPCWKPAAGASASEGASAAGGLRCLPSFLVTGLFHAGALSLAGALMRHPNVATDGCSNCQFWGEDGKSMAFYLQEMRNAAQKAAQAPKDTQIMDYAPSTFAFYWAAAGKAHRAFGESIRPCHANCSDEAGRGLRPVRQCMNETCYPAAIKADMQRAAKAGIDYMKDQHLPLLVRAVYGNRIPKMVLLARDPVQRLYSAYFGYPHYHNKYGLSSEGFTAYVTEMISAIRACEAKFGPVKCALIFEGLGVEEEAVYYHADQIMRGMYSVYLELWMRYIPKSYWLVIKSEEYFADPKATVKRVVAWLGLPETNEQQLKAMMGGPAPLSYVKDKAPMEPSTQKLLADFYAPYNKALSELTGDVRFASEWINE